MGVGVLEVGVEAKVAGGEDLLSTIVENLGCWIMCWIRAARSCESAVRIASM